MEDLPATKMGSANLPLFAHCIGSQNECTLARPDQDSYTAHLSLSPMRRSPPSLSATIVVAAPDLIWPRSELFRPDAFRPNDVC